MGDAYMYENYSVLFVDDEINILNTLRRSFMDEYFTSYFANSGKEALEILKEHEIHLIISDMKMPEMSGLELFRIVEIQYPFIVKVILSGYTQLSQILVTINQVDIFKFMTKPWESNDMEIVVKKSLDYYILQEESREQKKVLEKKNQSYQNILKRIDDIVIEAKKKSAILGNCGKAILSFGRNFNINERMRFHSLFLIEEDIYTMIADAVIKDTKECGLSEIEEAVVDANKNILAKINIEPTIQDYKKYKVNIDMFKATLSILLLVFQNEIIKNNLLIQISSNDNLKISLISPNRSTTSSPDTSVIDVKISFVKPIILEALKESELTFQIVQKNEGIFMTFTINPVV